MRLALATLAIAFALPLAAGEEGSWSGMLADAACKQRTPDAACPVGGSTSAFGLVTADGHFLPFDSAGNQKAAAAIKTSSESGNPVITVTGSTDGKTVAVKAIRVS